jgi:hypothetical protein
MKKSMYIRTALASYVDEQNTVFQGLSRRSVTWRPEFDAGSVHVRFVVEKMALGSILLPVVTFSRVSVSSHHRSVITKN